jgi:hypothetical protein
MDEAPYQKWREELAKWLAQRKVPPLNSKSAHLAAKPALEVLAHARQTIAGINATFPGGKILDLNKYDHLASILDKVLAMESLSLAEYTYNLPGDKNPGIRLWYESSAGQPQITLLLFEDVHEWRVDLSGKKVSWQILRLYLSSEQPLPDLPGGAKRFFTPGQGWRNMLNDALSLPMRLFYLS